MPCSSLSYSCNFVFISCIIKKDSRKTCTSPRIIFYSYGISSGITCSIITSIISILVLCAYIGARICIITIYLVVISTTVGWNGKLSISWGSWVICFNCDYKIWTFLSTICNCSIIWRYHMRPCCCSITVFRIWSCIKRHPILQRSSISTNQDRIIICYR